MRAARKNFYRVRFVSFAFRFVAATTTTLASSRLGHGPSENAETGSGPRTRDHNACCYVPSYSVQPGNNSSPLWYLPAYCARKNTKPEFQYLIQSTPDSSCVFSSANSYLISISTFLQEKYFVDSYKNIMQTTAQKKNLFEVGTKTKSKIQ